MMPEEFDEKGSGDPDQGERERRWSEGVLRDTLRKAVEKGIEAGVGTLRSADSALRGVTQVGKIPTRWNIGFGDNNGCRGSSNFCKNLCSAVVLQ